MAEKNKAKSELLDRLLDAALIHVPFDGWSDISFNAAISDSGIDPALAQAVCPRGAVDLAVAYHQRGDDLMVARLAEEDLSEMKFRDKITRAVQLRLEVVEDKEAVRRGATLFALPQYAPDGARALWGTVDRIWSDLGDRSEDVNWYTKRATLSGVYSATVLYWLGDDSPDHQRTWRFLDRRIDDVMSFETFKKKVNDNPFLKPFLAGPNWAMSRIKAPGASARGDLPGCAKGKA
ncbi:MAG: COQ9 family protein [Mangrovicoccus sp.]|nr:COQ9 family protein [Mangrovicoccus sp.]